MCGKNWPVFGRFSIGPASSKTFFSFHFNSARKRTAKMMKKTIASLGHIQRRSHHHHHGLLQSIPDFRNANFYSNSMNLRESKLLLKNTSHIYQSAVKDVPSDQVGNYLDAIKVTASSFIMKDEVFDREEILSQFRSLIRERGNFVCLLGGKSTGKSLIFQHLQNSNFSEKNESVFIIDMRLYGVKRDMLESLLKSLSQTKTVRAKEFIKKVVTEAIVPFVSSSISPYVGEELTAKSIASIMEEIQKNRLNESEILEKLLSELSILFGNMTIVIDEANLAFDPYNSNDETLNKAKADLQVFTRLTKQTKKV